MRIGIRITHEERGSESAPPEAKKRVQRFSGAAVSEPLILKEWIRIPSRSSVGRITHRI